MSSEKVNLVDELADIWLEMTIATYGNNSLYSLVQIVVTHFVPRLQSYYSLAFEDPRAKICRKEFEKEVISRRNEIYNNVKLHSIELAKKYSLEEKEIVKNLNDLNNDPNGEGLKKFCQQLISSIKCADLSPKKFLQDDIFYQLEFTQVSLLYLLARLKKLIDLLKSNDKEKEQAQLEKEFSSLLEFLQDKDSPSTSLSKDVVVPNYNIFRSPEIPPFYFPKEMPIDLVKIILEYTTPSFEDIIETILGAF